MASLSLPRPGYNAGLVTTYEHELLAKKAVSDGVHGFPTDPMPVYAESTAVRTVRVRSGVFAHVRGSLYQSGSTDISLPQLAANASGQPRIDTVVLRLDRSDYRVFEQVITGTPAANPVAPALVRNAGSTGFYDLPLVDVRVDHGATNLAADKVTCRCWYIGSDGQLRCTADTRPPHEANRNVWEHPTGRHLVSTGSRWLVTAEDAGPLLMDMMAGYSATENTAWRRNGWAFGQLTFTRVPTGMNGGVPYTPARLPEGLWPPFTYQTNAQCPSLQITCTVAVLPTGYIRVNPGVDIPANRSIVLDALSHPVA